MFGSKLFAALRGKPKKEEERMADELKDAVHQNLSANAGLSFVSKTMIAKTLDEVLNGMDKRKNARRKKPS